MAGHERGGLHRIPNAIGYRIHGVDMGNAVEIVGRLQCNSIVDSPRSPATGIKVGRMQARNARKFVSMIALDI